MNKWYFPYGMDIEKESVNNARIETFKDNIVESLAREICQNSLDAVKDQKKPVEVSFDEKTIVIPEVLDDESFIYTIIPKARKTWAYDETAIKFLEEYEDILRGKEVKVLKISDYNTMGLKEGNWESLIERAGSSVKDDVASAGSFGIGKAAPFASSNLRMVFYSTLLEDGSEKSIGVTRFISFDNEDGSTAQGIGYLGEKKKQAFSSALSFGFEARNESGTDIYIISFNQKNWQEKMKESILENFMMSIYEGKLIVRVEDEVIDDKSMGNFINALTGKKFLSLKNYYSVLQDPAMLKVALDERFEKYGFKADDGILYLSKKEDANRSVLMTRAAGMKILDRKGISGSIQFNGIFMAKGQRFNQILKKMENPNHNDWIASRYEDDPKLAKNLLSDIYRFIKENVLENYKEKIKSQVDAFGVSDFLPNRSNKDESSKKAKEEISLKDRIKDIKLNKKKSKPVKMKEISGKDFEYKLKKEGIISGDKSGPGSPRTGEGSGESGENSIGVGEDKGKYDTGESDNKSVFKRYENFKEFKGGKFKVFEENYESGDYRLIVESNKNLKALKIEISLVGESGYGYKDNIEEVNFNNKKLEKRKNCFILENIKKNQKYIVSFKLPYEDRIKMGVKLYENK